MAYPDHPTYSEKRAAKELYNALPHILPCPVCREHFREVLVGMPVETWLDNRESLVEWVWTAHNRVNARLGKPEISRQEFERRYREMAERGLPIPPAAASAEISDAAVQAAFIRGASAAAGVIGAAALVGWLLWISYKGR